MKKSLYDTNLFFIAEGKVVYLLFEVKIHYLCKLIDSLCTVLFVEAGGIFQQINYFHVIVVKHLRWQVTNFFSYLRVLYAVLSKDGRAATQGIDEPLSLIHISEPTRRT